MGYDIYRKLCHNDVKCYIQSTIYYLTKLSVLSLYYFKVVFLQGMSGLNYVEGGDDLRTGWSRPEMKMMFC